MKLPQRFDDAGPYSVHPSLLCDRDKKYANSKRSRSDASRRAADLWLCELRETPVQKLIGKFQHCHRLHAGGIIGVALELLQSQSITSYQRALLLHLCVLASLRLKLTIVEI